MPLTGLVNYNKWDPNRPAELWGSGYGVYWKQQLLNEMPTLNTSAVSQPKEEMGAAWAKNIGYGSAILSGLNEYRQADAYESQANTAATNAALARSQIDQVSRAGARESNATREKGQRMIGAARAAYGASGVDSNVGSAGAAQDAIAYRTERDAQTTLQNTAIKQWALGNEAAQYDAQAQSYRNMAKQQKRSALINTALKVASIYYGVGL